MVRRGSSSLSRPVTFQSLFFWIHFYNSGGNGIHNRNIIAAMVSILVFLDSLLQRAECAARPASADVDVSILVFLDSLLQPDATTIRRSTEPATSFNPCFSGFTSTTRHGLDFKQFAQRVSILVFLDSLLQPVQRPPLCRVSGRVSILVFLDSLLQLSFLRTQSHYGYPIGFNPCFSGFTSTTERSLRRKPRRPSHCSFNPCFSGFTSTTAMSSCIHLRPIGLLVSILVFLDSLLQLKAGTWAGARALQTMFQSLVFLDSLLQPVGGSLNGP